jgi:hypothetical protein
VGVGSGRFYVPTREPEDWAGGLADRSQWAAGKSAYELAYAWERAGGRLPTSVSACLAGAAEVALRDVTPLVGLPEHRVDLGDGRRASQTDLLVVARSGRGGLVVLAVEGKKSESFGSDTVSGWLAKTKTGSQRLALVCERIGLSPGAVGDVYYQLLHRAAAAVLEARRFGARHAVMAVHSFSSTHQHLGAYQAFVALYGKQASVGQVVKLATLGDVVLHAVWVTDDKQPAKGAFGGLEIADDAVGWLRRHYRDQTFYCERDIEAVLQRRIVDLISEQRLTGLRVRRNRHIRGPSVSKQVDLAVEDAAGSVVLAMEVKYEPSPSRPDLARADGRRPDPVTFWSEIRKDFELAHALVTDDAVLAAVAILVDEGGWLSEGAAPANGIWETWDELASGKPDWLTPRALRAALAATVER